MQNALGLQSQGLDELGLEVKFYEYPGMIRDEGGEFRFEDFAVFQVQEVRVMKR